MMMPVGGLTVIRTFPEIRTAEGDEFRHHSGADRPAAWPDGGRADRTLVSWRQIFFVNVPMGIVALWLIYRYMPDYRGDAPHPLDVKGLLLFGSGTALISWLLEIFGEHEINSAVRSGGCCVACTLLGMYVRHARRIALSAASVLALFHLRTFRVSVAGGFVTRFGVGALPFLCRCSSSSALAFPALAIGRADDADCDCRHGHEIYFHARAAPLWLPHGVDSEHGDDRCDYLLLCPVRASNADSRSSSCSASHRDFSIRCNFPP